MNGRSIQDIVPPARTKPLRPPGSHQSNLPSNPPPQPPQPPQRPPERIDMEPHGKRGGSMIFVWIALGAIVIVALVITLMSTVFHTARAEVTLLEWKSDISGSYNGGGEALAYEAVSVTETATRTVQATGSTDAKDHASGTIIVSNLHSTQPQRLITNTRFESTDGKIYRIHAPITVPGYTTKNGQKVAGTLEATVYADQPGEAYNIASGEFKLPGLKGTNQYDVITARTKGAISGGFVGRRATVEKSVRDQAVTEIKAELDRTLREKIVAASPANSVIFGDSISVRYVENPDKGEGDQATISVIGTAVAPAFPGDALARELASHAAISSDAPLELRNASEISYTPVDAIAVESGGPITFTLSGTAHLAAQFAPLKLSQDLAGHTESEAEAVRAGYPALIGPMTVTVYPFWLSTLPSNPERITVDVKGALDQNN